MTDTTPPPSDEKRDWEIIVYGDSGRIQDRRRLADKTRAEADALASEFCDEVDGASSTVLDVSSNR